MVQVHDGGHFLLDGREMVAEGAADLLGARLGGQVPQRAQAALGTMAHRILEAHNTSGSMDKLRIKFDALASHDITYVGIIQTARASGLEEFPLPYVLTNCHNSLCAVGGTINEDDHMFGLSAAKRYGGEYVPAHLAVIHQYMREMHSGCGRMILGSDSHTRYGALGTMAVGEGGPELVKQLLGKTYDIDMPEIVAVYLSGSPKPGVGPQDVALAIIGAVFQKGVVKNKVLEFVGEGIRSLSADYRIGIDVMTTETTCLSSIWETDDTIREYLALHGREVAFEKLAPAPVAYYDGVITVELDKVEPMVALPFHPSNTYTIRALNENLEDILNGVEREAARQLENSAVSFSLRDKIVDGKLLVQQGVIAGCAGGTFENICAAADIIGETSLGSGAFSLSVYPSSQPVNLELTKNGAIARLMAAGAVMRTAFCGPCFGAGDVPANNGLSVRHTTRNFPNREGSKPGSGQIAAVALMDARSIAATAARGGVLTPATDLEVQYTQPRYAFEKTVYGNRCYQGYGRANTSVPLQLGPNIADWPAMEPLADNLLLRVVSVITDPVTTTDELIPSGETSSYRSNPLRLAEFTLSRKDPAYVGRAKEVRELERRRLAGAELRDADLDSVLACARRVPGMEGLSLENTAIGSVVYARKPGDGSAREQAASCQKVLGTFANIAAEYATKRYRSNLVNWGMLPFTMAGEPPFSAGDYLLVPDIRALVTRKVEQVTTYLLADDGPRPVALTLSGLTEEERAILLAGCLINHYRQTMS